VNKLRHRTTLRLNPHPEDFLTISKNPGKYKFVCVSVCASHFSCSNRINIFEYSMEPETDIEEPYYTNEIMSLFSERGSEYSADPTEQTELESTPDAETETKSCASRSTTKSKKRVHFATNLPHLDDVARAGNDEIVLGASNNEEERDIGHKIASSTSWINNSLTNDLIADSEDISRMYETVEVDAVRMKRRMPFDVDLSLLRRCFRSVRDLLFPSKRLTRIHATR
jgi:hypothetical protein